MYPRYHIRIFQKVSVSISLQPYNQDFSLVDTAQYHMNVANDLNKKRNGVTTTFIGTNAFVLRFRNSSPVRSDLLKIPICNFCEKARSALYLERKQRGGVIAR